MQANALTQVRTDDLLLLDRGFPVYWLFAWLIEHQRHFCMWASDGAAGMGQLAAFFRSRATEAILQIEMPAPALRKAAAQGRGSLARSDRPFQYRAAGQRDDFPQAR